VEEDTKTSTLALCNIEYSENADVHIMIQQLACVNEHVASCAPPCRWRITAMAVKSRVDPVPMQVDDANGQSENMSVRSGRGFLFLAL
jgi:hypothetical protein